MSNVIANDREYLWVEKYRPMTIDACILPQRMRDYFKGMTKPGSELQNTLMLGSAGCGKTTSAKALCNELGIDSLVINCSENGNIDTLRTTIRGFASTMSFNSPYKVIILDEADGLNPNSTQPALRGFIEEFSRNCRFIFTANFGNKIIEPLKSRLAVIEFTFSKEEKQQMAMAFDARVKEILTQEGVEFDKKVLAQVLVKYFPDFRKVLNELQRHSSGGSISTGIVTAMGADVIGQLYALLKNPSKWNDMRKWVTDNSDNEFALIIRAIYDNASTHVKPASMPQLILTLAEYDYKNGFVADKEINTVAMLTEIMSQVEFL